MPRRSPAPRAAVGATLALAVALAGCATPAEPEPTPTKTAAATIFASDEEALAAAEEAMTDYVKSSDQIAVDGGVDAERIQEFATGREAEEALEFFERLHADGMRQEGSTTFDSTKLQEWFVDDGIVNVSIYLCIDVSGNRIVATDGRDATPEGRKLRVPRTALLTRDADSDEPLKVQETDRWPGDDFC